MRIIVKTKYIFIALLINAATTQATIAERTHDEYALKTVSSLAAELELIFEKNISDDIQRANRVSSLFDTYFDLGKIAQGSVGQYWKVANSEEKKEYQKLIRKIIVQTVTRRLDQIKGLHFEIQKSEPKGRGLVFVDGVFTDKKQNSPDVKVRWLVLKKDENTAKIVDVVIENLSMITTQRQENISVIRRGKGKFSALIDAMTELSESKN